jgi:HPt (histidine-containing phosphotransfer) domain-containing protein
MREMFLEKGFNDFLSKPIDISKLDEILVRWIPKEKRVISSQRSADSQIHSTLHSQFPNIPDVDVQKGIAMTGGTETGYHAVLTMFNKDAKERQSLLQTVSVADELPVFITNVHALKSASASIGAGKISSQAAELEAAGNAGDMLFINQNLPIFRAQLVELINGIDDALNIINKTKSETLTMESLIPLLHKLEITLQSKKADDIDLVLKELMQQPLDVNTRYVLDQISYEVLMAEYEKAGKILDKFTLKF